MGEEERAEAEAEEKNKRLPTTDDLFDTTSFSKFSPKSSSSKSFSTSPSTDRRERKDLKKRATRTMLRRLSRGNVHSPWAVPTNLAINPNAVAPFYRSFNVYWYNRSRCRQIIDRNIKIPICCGS